MIGIRQKLMLGFGILVGVIMVMGSLTMTQIDDLGKAVDLILKENYRSVIACQDMKESLERIDSGVLFTLAGNEAQGTALIGDYITRFSAALAVELGNLTLPGEGEKAARIEALFAAYTQAIPLVTDGERSLEKRRDAYFDTLEPLFREIKETAQGILAMNQQNMGEANDRARALAVIAHQRLLAGIIFSAVLAVLFGYLAHRWILRPVNRLIDFTEQVRQGNLDHVLQKGSRDEIGQLSESFNEMAAVLRQTRKQEHMKLARTRRATEEIFRALPVAIAILDLSGRVEIATGIADRNFGLNPGRSVKELGFEWLAPLIDKALAENRLVRTETGGGFVQEFVDNREYFIQPMAVPISSDSQAGEAVGIALILNDATQVYEQRELKRDAVSVVSHQLKTPLTSLRMAVHLLLEERLGALTEKQAELLLAARDDSDRLSAIIDDLLDLGRIESGKASLLPEPVSPAGLAREAMESFQSEARDRGVTLTCDIPENLPEVLADRKKIRHVFANLFSNALRYTSAGGSITVKAHMEEDHVRFCVEDTGKGLREDDMKHMFERFYRGSGQNEASGVGLGLAIVKEIVTAHGGEVEVESKIDVGSSFQFTLPTPHDKDAG